MTAKTGHSQKQTPVEAAQDLKSQLGGDARLVLFFASSNYDPAALGKAVKDAFPNAEVAGCTTSGELVSGKMLKGSVVAMGFPAALVGDVRVEVIETPADPQKGVEKAFAGFEQHFKKSMRELDHKKYVGVICVDGLSLGEEKVMERIGDLTNVSFVGGSAGDDLKFKTTHVFANGKAHTNAAVVALMKPSVPFHILKTQSFQTTGKVFVITKADEKTRTVLELNGEPAALVYAQAVGAKAADASKHFMTNPVGMVSDGEIFVRSPQQIKDDAIVFYCSIKQGMQVSLLQSGDIVAETRRAFEAKRKELRSVSAVVNFHCILRTLELEAKNQCDAYGKLFTDVPMVGYSTYGEQLVGHINQTSTMLIFE